jgi:mono/diheme cytochrome c family protein
MLTVSVGMMLVGFSAFAGAEGNSDIGKLEYDAHCAVCHGVSGKGDDSSLKSELVKPVPDLTTLAKSNNGVFPFDVVYQVIDGRKDIKTHGSRDMPIWGSAFKSETSVYFDKNAPYSSESIIRSRILALVEYLHRLQVK